MGLNYNINTFTPYVPTLMTLGGYGTTKGTASSNSQTESPEEIQKRKQKEERAKAFLENLVKRNDEIIEEQEQNEETDTTLTDSERRVLKKEGLLFDEDILKESEGSLATSMLLTTPFLIPTLNAAKKAKTNTIEMFYQKGGAHMDLFSKNPDLMINAQESMQKLERKFASDLKAAKGNSALVNNITAERDLFRDTMQKALKSNNPQEIAKATAQCNTAAEVKNGMFSRFFRGMKNKPEIHSRFDATAKADRAGKFLNIKPPQKGVSFLKSLCGNKISWILTAGMAITPVLLDWGNIQKAIGIDNKNKQNNKNTDYASKQIKQTAIKGGASALTYMVADTAVRTLTKKCLGKFAAKLATQIAVKGGCKILGSAIGSIVPGFGTAAGLIVGTAADFLLNKYVFANMDFFKNTAIQKAEIESCSDEELIKHIGEQYSLGNKMHNKKILALLKRKCGSDNFEELKRMHNMSEKERNEYLAELQKMQEQQKQGNTQEQQELQTDAANN